MGKVSRISGGILLGFLTGAIAVTLLAPRSGAENRLAIEERIQAILEEGRQAADARRFELTAQLEELKKPRVPQTDSNFGQTVES